MGNRVRCVFFDLGGTILDISCCYLGLAEAWRELGISAKASPTELTGEWIAMGQELHLKGSVVGDRGLFEVSSRAMMAAMAHLGIPGDHVTALKLTEAAWKAVRQLAKPFPDAAPSVFEELQGLGYRLGIITDVDLDVFRAVSSRVPCLEAFDPIVCSWEVGVTKPDVRIFQHALGLADCRPHEAVFVGDVPLDVQGAKATGMFAAIVDRRRTYPQQPRPDLVISGLGELPGALGRLGR